VGTRLLEYYVYAKRRGGLALQMKLAMRTLLSEPKAALAPDSPGNVRLFYEALRELLPDDPKIPPP
jgi:hypothetical protein